MRPLVDEPRAIVAPVAPILPLDKRIDRLDAKLPRGPWRVMGISIAAERFQGPDAQLLPHLHQPLNAFPLHVQVEAGEVAVGTAGQHIVALAHGHNVVAVTVPHRGENAIFLGKLPGRANIGGRMFRPVPKIGRQAVPVNHIVTLARAAGSPQPDIGGQQEPTGSITIAHDAEHAAQPLGANLPRQCGRCRGASATFPRPPPGRRGRRVSS